eukprot:TRINITY_DN6513_c0_g1_i1.p1 TRINITY_DN6513_c0_g1~~TRINITY_DN6513_c0_g1_i1.p1  ORF type:complete len:1344 (+),score=430.13 TRINITY_DN6513_c0_g1_i1:61-4092(+)
MNKDLLEQDDKGRLNYQVRVHIIEARDLKGRSKNGQSDPVCLVNCFGKKRFTSKHRNTTSCIWDHLMFFETDLPPSEWEKEKITISVFDANTFFRNELIGLYEFDVSSVYGRKDHEVYRKWLGLTDSDNHTGLQGFLQVSVTCLKPGDDAPLHEEEYDDDEGDSESQDLNSLVLLPPKITLTGYNLIVRIYKAEQLSKMDRVRNTSSYIGVRFAGNRLTCTDVKKNTNEPFWNQEIRIPVFTPTLSNLIELQVNNREGALSTDKMIGTPIYFKFTDIQNETVNPMWVNLYGSRVGAFGEQIKMALKKGIKGKEVEATSFSGRVLLSVDAERNDEPRLGIKSISPCQLPSEEPYNFRFDLYEAAELPLNNSENVKIVVNLGPTKLYSKKKSTKGGRATWYEPFAEQVLKLPSNVDSIPDIIINVFAESKVLGKSRIGFAKLKASEVLGLKNKPNWISLEPDKTVTSFKEGTIPGFLLARINLGPSSDTINIPRSPINQPTTKGYELRAHIYQGRELPASNYNGFSDPFVEVRLGHKTGKTHHVNSTLYPRWYKTVTLQVELPQPLTLAPNVTLMVHDHNQVSANVFLGRFEVPILNIPKRWPGHPRWYDIYRKTPTKVYGGILASFQLIPLEEAAKYPVPSIIPDYKECLLEINSVGIRDLLPYGLKQISSPYVEYDVGDRSSENGIVKTEPSSIPNGENANHLQVLRLPVRLPLNPLYAPTVNVRVYDSRSITKPLVATTAIPLAPLMPWSNLEKKRENLPPLVDTIPGALDEPGDKDDIHLDLEGGSMNDEVGYNEKDEHVIPENLELLNEQKGATLKFITKKNDDLIDSQGIRTIPDVEETTLPFDDEDEDPFGIKEKDNEVGDLYEDNKPSKEKKKSKKNEELEGMNEDKDLGFTSHGSIKHELEHDLKDWPFDEYTLFRGRQAGRSGVEKLVETKRRNEMSRARVGTLKASFRVIEVSKLEISPKSLDLEEMYMPRKLVVRVYVIKGIQFIPNKNGKGTPFLKLSTGKNKNQNYDDISNRKEKTISPDFFKCYELIANLPGDSKLTINAYDYSPIGLHDFIGSTVVDLENRYFSSEWKDISPKPIEYRNLWTPTSSNPQGKLKMWIEIMTEMEAANTPIEVISPPVPIPFELRAVIWNTKDCVFKDDNGNDIFVSAKLEGKKRQKTDIHWRSEDGKGAFNYRMIWKDVVLPMKWPRFNIQIWDKDVLSPNEAIAEAVINLRGFFNKSWRKKATQKINRQWVKMTHPNFEGTQGQVEIELELLTEYDALNRPAGLGRKPPNQHPHLPEPERPWSSFPPWRLDKQFLNFFVKHRKKAFIVIAILIFVFVIFFLIPFIKKDF